MTKDASNLPPTIPIPFPSPFPTFGNFPNTFPNTPNPSNISLAPLPICNPLLTASSIISLCWIIKSSKELGSSKLFTPCFTDPAHALIHSGLPVKADLANAGNPWSIQKPKSNPVIPSLKTSPKAPTFCKFFTHILGSVNPTWRANFSAFFWAVLSSPTNIILLNISDGVFL